MPIRLYLSLFLSTLIVISLSGCDRHEEYKDLDAYVAELRREEIKRHSKPSESVEIVLPPTATYKADNLRAPFQRNDTTAASAKSLAVDPLQRYPITMLRFVGTLTKNNVIYAYILAPDSMLYEVKQGDLIGDHYGRVSNIDSKRITITEETEPGKRSMQTMQLREEQQ